MKSLRFSFLLSVFPVVTALLGGSAQASTISTSAWSTLYQGIDFATASVDASQADILRVDLTAPGIGFLTTRAGGPLNTFSATTSQFLEGSGAQVAINSNFFSPCCSTTASQPTTVIGLAVSNGSLVAPPVYGTDVGSPVLLLSKNNQATITRTTNPGSVNLANVYNAVAGSGIIVANGVNISATVPSGGDPNNPNPRTDVGTSQNGRYLYLATIDGREPGHSIGATDSEAADLMIAVGAYDALNLDGGGSTTMVRSDGQGDAIALNQPSSGAERYVADNLGVFAQPLAVPEPAGLFGIGLLGVLLVRRWRFRAKSETSLVGC
jgi:hypothetical protein